MDTILFPNISNKQNEEMLLYQANLLDHVYGSVITDMDFPITYWNKAAGRKLFQPFVQADTSLERNDGGLALGLSIRKEIAELHGGSVSAYSEGQGKGAEFIIRLPLSDMKKPNLAEETKQTNTPQSLKILVIEDNKDFAELMSTILAENGHQAMVSYNGHEGIEKAKRYKPDIIFCDIGLPGLNGYEVAKAIKEDSDFKDTCLVALTGYAGGDEQMRTMECGFDRHLAKPVNLDAILQLINEY